MNLRRCNRRQFSAGLAALGTGTLVRPARGQSPGRVVVAGGGFAGATCARAMRVAGAEVTLLEPQPTYTACPMSNAVLAGLRDMAAQSFGYDPLRRAGVEVRQQAAVAVETVRREVVLADGARLAYDRLVLAPGVDLRFDALPGYDETAAEIMPHAWKAGPQTELLRRQLEAMPEDGVVVMTVPANPYRCPPGPYERASLIAHYLKTAKPRAKLLVLDAKDRFSKQGLFEAAWAELYPGLIEWVPLSGGGNVVAVNAKTRTLVTEFGEYRADVANVIPPQRAAALADAAGVADASGWCPIDPVTFESRLQPLVHVIGDAAIAGAMPKSAFAANAQAKACAVAVTALLGGETPPEPRLINTCYSLVAPDYGISIAGVYRPSGGLLTEVEGAGGVSPKDVPRAFRAKEAAYAEAWFETIGMEVFG
jgi:NADPH-dependent 2,4-dienoyl-CoA reductase/sulfur reductase-like enzyme